MTPKGKLAAGTTRLETLSDGVFAIAMTLLVLDLRPPARQGTTLAKGLADQWPAYVGFVASFLFIAVVWTNHHATFREIHSTDRGLTWANLGILFGTVLLPFPTAVLADAFRGGIRADEQTAACLYAALAVLMTLAWLGLFFRLDRRSYPGPIDARLAPWRTQMLRPIVGSLGYTLGALLGFVIAPTLSLILFVAVPLYYAVTSEGLRGDVDPGEVLDAGHRGPLRRDA